MNRVSGHKESNNCIIGVPEEENKKNGTEKSIQGNTWLKTSQMLHKTQTYRLKKLSKLQRNQHLDT